MPDSEIQVLELNIASAEGAGQTEDNTQLKVLAHVYTRVQEELEKQIEPPAGLLHRFEVQGSRVESRGFGVWGLESRV